MRGALILVEGLDRAGKSTQCDRLVEKLRSTGRKVELLKFPDRTTGIGQMINTYLTQSSTSLSDQAIHLLFSSNRWEVAPKLLELLEGGTTVVLDRYIYSGIAFSAAKEVPGMSLAWCRNPDVGLPLPDLTVFLDVSEEVAQQRGGYGQERYEKLEIQRKVRQYFYKLGEMESKDKWATVSANGTLDEVFIDIWQKIQPVVDGDLGPVAKLEP